MTSRDRNNTTGVENFVNDVVIPVQTAALRVSQSLRSVSVWLSDVRNLRAENERLSKQVDEIESLRAQLEEALGENRRLRDLAGFAERSSFTYVSAEVLGRNTDNWFSTIIIDRGSADSIQKDWPVAGSRGLLGRVMKVSEHTATVILLLDSDSSVGAMVERSRDMGIVFGGRTDGLLTMTMFSRDADVREGDTIVTSGAGSLYPRGILVGYVERVERQEYGLVKSAVIRPSSDFGRIEEVLIIRPPVEERPR